MRNDSLIWWDSVGHYLSSVSLKKKNEGAALFHAVLTVCQSQHSLHLVQYHKIMISQFKCSITITLILKSVITIIWLELLYSLLLYSSGLVVAWCQFQSLEDPICIQLEKNKQCEWLFLLLYQCPHHLHEFHFFLLLLKAFRPLPSLSKLPRHFFFFLGQGSQASCQRSYMTWKGRNFCRAKQ